MRCEIIGVEGVKCVLACLSKALVGDVWQDRLRAPLRRSTECEGMPLAEAGSSVSRETPYRSPMLADHRYNLTTQGTVDESHPRVLLARSPDPQSPAQLPLEISQTNTHQSYITERPRASTLRVLNVSTPFPPTPSAPPSLYFST